MSRLQFQLTNPFKVKDKIKKDYILYYRSITKNKSLEIQLTKWRPNILFEVTLDINFSGRDHAGFEFSCEVFGLYFHVNIYDNRHWDYESNDWEVYPPKE